MARKILSATALSLLIAAQAVHAETKEECAGRVDQLMQAGAVNDLTVKGGTVVVVVDEASWKLVDFAVKSALAAAIDCAILGPDMVLPEISFRSNMTNNVLGTSTNGKLVVEPN